MGTKTENRIALEMEYEDAIADEHRLCYENELDCLDLDAIVELMNEVNPANLYCVQCHRWATHFSNDLEESPRCDYHRTFYDADQVSSDVLGRAFDYRRELLDRGCERIALTATELVRFFYRDDNGMLTCRRP